MPLSVALRLVKIGLALVLLGVATFAALSTRTDSATRDATTQVVMWMAGVVAGVGLILAWLGWRALRLANPANTIASWTIKPSEWQLYVAACQMRVTMPGALPGAVPLDPPVPLTGIEVLALKRGFRVGDSIHEVGSLGAEVMDMRRVDKPVHMFEFNMRYTTSRYSSVQQSVRIPIALEAHTLANQVEDYWVKRQPLQTMTIDQLKARSRNAGTIALLGLLAFVFVIAYLAMTTPPAWTAVLPITAGGVAGWGFARWIVARSVRFRREGKIS